MWSLADRTHLRACWYRVDTNPKCVRSTKFINGLMFWNHFYFLFRFRIQNIYRIQNAEFNFHIQNLNFMFHNQIKSKFRNIYVRIVKVSLANRASQMEASNIRWNYIDHCLRLSKEPISLQPWNYFGYGIIW